ncbi:MAG: hypothetical protein A2252_12655 [Elusimicrobia bacterium RIFOXYA2_FULL_39_19]|nr:MAG: hypothetical protein A2252_12655 [Elusimicrobia bacterium RIFOXYA2_FULL_39_19]
MKNKIIFILGGVKSGKSSFALEQAKKLNKPVSYIATAVITDKEIAKRVKNHRLERPASWQTIEESNNLLNALKKVKNKTIVVDCINFLVSNLIYQKNPEPFILKHITEFCNEIKKKNLTVYLISNEVGLSLISPYKLGRDFQSTLGKINQILAKQSNETHFLIAGIPMKIK